MGNWPHLPKAPIVEALIDFQVRLPAETTLEVLSEYHAEVKDRYPERRTRSSWSGKIAFPAEGRPSVEAYEAAPDGYQFRSADDRQVVQARLDGFTFSRLRPYETWEHLRDEARELWQRYVRLAKPVAITRLAVRYINRLDLPGGAVRLEDWLLTMPSVAPDLPRTLAGYFMRFGLSFAPSGAMALITEAMQPPPAPNMVRIILDIDVFQEQPVEVQDDCPVAWEQLEELREIKNKIFFHSLTNKAVEQFQ